MSRAQNEVQVLLQMEHHLDTYGKIGATSQGWTNAKRGALDKLSAACETHFSRGVVNVLDIGIGDMSHIDHWLPFTMGTADYLGVDGSARILGLANGRFPAQEEPARREYRHQTLSEWIAEEEAGWDAVVCLDVLYHIHTDDLYEKFRAALLAAADNFLLVSYAISNVTQGAPQKPGDPGFAWFPRTWEHPEGFTQIWYADNTGCGQPQRQALSLYVRD